MPVQNIACAAQPTGMQLQIHVFPAVFATIHIVVRMMGVLKIKSDTHGENLVRIPYEMRRDACGLVSQVCLYLYEDFVLIGKVAVVDGNDRCQSFRKRYGVDSLWTYERS